MAFLRALKKNVPAQIFRRGENCYYNGKIQQYDVNPVGKNQFKIKARVRGTTMYQVKLVIKIEDKRISLSGDCSCPYNWGDICKHEVAVLHKFLIEDYPKLGENGVIYQYNKLVELSHKVNLNKIPISYYLKGMLTDTMVNFRLTIKSETLSSKRLEEIISYIHNPDLYFINSDKVKAGLDDKDGVYIEFLRQVETTRSRIPASILFPKDNSNFSFLMNLIREREVFFEETGNRAQTGKPIYPGLIVEGTEDNISINLQQQNYPIYEQIDTNSRQRLTWTVIDSRIHLLEMDSFKEIPHNIIIPEEKKGEFLFELLPSLEERISLKIAGGLKEYRLIKKEPEISLLFDYREGALFCSSMVEIGGESFKNSQILQIDLDNKHYERADNTRIWYCWDVEAMQTLIDFLDYNKFHVHPEGFIIRDETDTQDFITDGFLHLPEEWEVKTTPTFDNLEIIPIELEPVVEFLEDGEDINWLEFTVTYNLGGKSYSYQELKDQLRYNKQGEGYIRIGNQYFILQETEQERKVNEVIKLAEEKDSGQYRSNFYNLLYYRSLLEETGIKFRGNRVFDEMNQDITGKNLIEEKNLPVQVKDVLRDYQKKGYYWFHFLDKYRFGGILADDMGLGKTLQTLTFLKSLKNKKPALIICPRTLIYNWGEEIEKFFPGTDYLVYYGTPAEREEMRENIDKYEFIITSYSIMSRDYKEMEDTIFSYCVLDEAQHIKNHRTKRAKGVKQVKARGKIALTGTPIENTVEELWSIMDFLMEGYLGNYNSFNNQYLNPINKNNDEEKLMELKKRVAPFILRRKKEDVLTELPEKLVNIHLVEMTRLQKDTYQVVLEETKNDLMKTISEKGFNRSRINILAVLTRLRQICNHPALVLDQTERKMNSGKMEALMEIVIDAIDGGHKLVIFSQFVQMLKLIRERFEKAGISYEYLDGSTRDRIERVKRFNQDNNIKTFLISLRAGGLGLNLTAADMVIHVDPWWNPMVERQATDRTHRMGQEKRVMVYKLITAGTVEEKMLKLQERKKHLFDSLIEKKSGLMSSVTWEDIQELLEYGC